MKLTFSDQTCLYQIILHGLGGNGEMLVKEKENPNLYYQEYKKLKYNSEYSVAVRGINTENERLESGLVWKQIKIPSCMEFFKNESICGPDPIVNLTASFTYLSDDKFNVKVTWNKLKHEPEFFVLEIKGGKSSNGNESGMNYYYTIPNVSYESQLKWIKT